MKLIPLKTGPRVSLLLRLAVSAALIAWVLARTPFHEVAAAFRSADPRWVLAALALTPFATLASVRRWQLLIRAQGGDATLPFLVRSFFVGVFFNNFLPSTIGGDTVRVLDTARTGVGRARAVAIVFVDRFVGLLTLMSFAVLGALRAPSFFTWVMGGAAVLALIAVLVFMLPRTVETRFALHWPGSVLARAFGWSLVLQALVVFNNYFLARALHVPIPLASFFLIVPLALFLMMLPVSINAIGVRENVWAFFLTAFGVAAATGVALAWLGYGLVLLQALVGGILYASRRETELPIGEGATL